MPPDERCAEQGNGRIVGLASLVTAGTTEQVGAVLRLIADVGWDESRFRMPGADGYFLEFDSYTEVADEMYLTLMRRLQGA